jgi:hypothetical protein
VGIRICTWALHPLAIPCASIHQSSLARKLLFHGNSVIALAHAALKRLACHAHLNDVMFNCTLHDPMRHPGTAFCRRCLSAAELSRRPHVPCNNLVLLFICSLQETMRYPGSGLAGVTSALQSSLPAPATPRSSTTLARGGSAACSEGSAASASASQLGTLSSDAHLRSDDLAMTSVLEPNPKVPESELAAWLRLSRDGKVPAAGGVGGGGGAGSETSSSGSSGAREAAFAEQLRRELHPQLGNPNIIG